MMWRVWKCLAGTHAVFTRAPTPQVKGTRSVGSLWIWNTTMSQCGTHSTNSSKAIPKENVERVCICMYQALLHRIHAKEYEQKSLLQSTKIESVQLSFRLVCCHSINQKEDIHLLRICCVLYSSQSSAAAKLASPRTPIGEVRESRWMSLARVAASLHSEIQNNVGGPVVQGPQIVIK